MCSNVIMKYFAVRRYTTLWNINLQKNHEQQTGLETMCSLCDQLSVEDGQKLDKVKQQQQEEISV